MARIRFTIGLVEKASCEPGKSQAFLWDTDAPGLGLRITQSGAKAYIFQSRVHANTVRVTIGSVDSWRLDAPAKSQDNSARKEARRLQTLCDAGIDPRDEKQDKKAESAARKARVERQRVTLREVWPSYIAANAHRWSDKHKRSHESLAHEGGLPRVRSKAKVTIAGPLASLLDVRLADLDADRLESWLQTESVTRPTAAALAFRLLRACVNWCEEQPEFTKLIPDNATHAKKVRTALPTPRTKDDCMQREQLSAWFKAIRELNNPIQSAYLQALLLTGARREELAALRWSEVDFKWNSLTIRDKVEGERTIPLTPYVASLLQGLSRENEWVFSSTTAASGHIVEPRIGHNKALAAAGLPPLTLHGLRRSFGTLSEWVECPVGIVAQIMGHKPSALAEKHYRRRPLDLLRMWHIRIETWILTNAQISQNVKGITSK